MEKKVYQSPSLRVIAFSPSTVVSASITTPDVMTRKMDWEDVIEETDETDETDNAPNRFGYWD